MKLNKIFKLAMLLMIIISAAILVWGFVVGWPQLGQEANAPVNTLLNWAYIMVGIAVFCCLIIGLVISAINNPKSLIKTLLVIVGTAAVCFIAYLLAKGAPATGREGLDTIGTLKLTDTILNLTYIVGAAAIVAIIVGEVRMAITDKKK